MVVINDRRSPVVRGTDEQCDKSNQGTRRPWMMPAWERQDTPMEVTMYAGQR